MSRLLEMMKSEARYFEFNKHEYYALLAVQNDKPNTTDIKAYKLYLEHVGGDNLDEVRLEGSHNELTKDEALLKYLNGIANYDSEETVQKAIINFKEAKDVPLLIDGSLL